ncbi:MAG: AAA family ATPase [Opitutaceae bacterium]|nr:AAA family ATPase [Opitutaceae bacterium]
MGRPDGAAIEGLSAEQRRAVGELLASCNHVVCLRGAAGVGKTTTLKALHRSLVVGGQRVHICAPTTSAVETLRHDAMTADTVAGFLARSAGREDLRGAVLVVDEAGLASNRQGAEILQLAERHQARVIFLGDSRQHASVEAGDFLRILETHAPLHRVELTDIRRQTVAAYREAVRHMATGSAKAGLERLDKLGWIQEGRADYLRAAVGDFLKLSDEGRRLGSVLAVTPTWEENHAFTDLLRNELKARGVLQPGEVVSTHEPLSWTKAQLARATNYTPGLIVSFDRAMAGFKRGDFATVSRVEGGKVWLQGPGGERCLPLVRAGFSVATTKPLEICPGDKLLVRANASAAKLINGQTLTVASVRDGQIETVEGRRIDTNRFKQFTHGFAVTSHRSQSKTCDHVVVAAARLDAKAAYVACSRGRLSCALHTPDKATLLGRLPEGKREAALDFPLGRLLPLDRTPAWERAAQEPRHEAGSVPVRAALRDSWWRGLLRGLGEWSRRVLPGQSVDNRNIEKNSSHANYRFPSL